MNHELRPGTKPGAEHMRVTVPQQQHGLEKHHHHRPYAGIAPEPRQDVAPYEGLDLEKQKCAQKYGQREYCLHHINHAQRKISFALRLLHVIS